MNKKQIVALLAKMFGKEETAAQDSETYEQVVDLVSLLLNPKEDPAQKQVINESNANVVQLANLLNGLQDKKQEPPKALYEDGFYKDGNFDLSKITDAGLKDALTDYLGKQSAKDNQRFIDDAFNAELAKRSLAIDKELFSKIIDLSKVTVTDGKVTGMTEAFDALKDKGVYKAQTSSPLLQGFNPVQNKETSASGTINSLFAAAQAEAEMNN
jgi:hypothetical protein